ncbi:MAG: adenylate/guanylate cyclase domain-containing protein [Chloroflexi bacterium]|nr:MAG: adenylate/guanylate cyclase domain-containing protein [Chloroflexota bacterium]
MIAAMEPRIQYARTSDGVSIAYATAGRGRIVIDVPSAPLSHVQRQWDLLSDFHGGLAERFRTIWYDSRGSGCPTVRQPTSRCRRCCSTWRRWLIARAKTGSSSTAFTTGSQTPFEMARKTSELIANSRLVQIDSPPFLDDPFELLRVVDGFLDKQSVETDGPQSWPGVFRTVLVTDLVSHTAMMSRLGDARGREVLREHERITRRVLKAYGGTEVKTMGDGFIASFGSVTMAVECAIGLQRAFAEREGEPLSVRVGLNAGEPIEEDGDLFGATVIRASRIAAKADGGEILVADTVRGLCSGKGFLFSDRGEFVAKGFEEPVRVYEVRWRDDS